MDRAEDGAGWRRGGGLVAESGRGRWGLGLWRSDFFGLFYVINGGMGRKSDGYRSNWLQRWIRLIVGWRLWWIWRVIAENCNKINKNSDIDYYLSMYWQLIPLDANPRRTGWPDLSKVVELGFVSPNDTQPREDWRGLLLFDTQPRTTRDSIDLRYSTTKNKRDQSFSLFSRFFKNAVIGFFKVWFQLNENVIHIA